MAGSISDYLELQWLDHIMMKGVWNAPGNIFLALSTTDPTDDGSGISEPAGGGYVRKSTAPGNWDVADSRLTDNAGELSFVQASAAWGNITYFAGYDLVAGGNMLFHGELDTPQNITNGDTFVIPAGNLDVQVNANVFSNYLANKMLDHTFGKAAYTPPSNVYVGLSLASPGDNVAGLDQPVGGSYARVSTAGGTWNVAAAGALDNAAIISFPQATGNWGNCTHGTLWDGQILHHAITGANVGAAGSGSFEVADDQTADLVTGAMLRVRGSTGNDGIYTIRAGSAFGGGTTTINVVEAVSDGTGDGDIDLLDNMLFHGALDTPKTVNNGNTFKFPVGDVDLTLD